MDRTRSSSRRKTENGVTPRADAFEADLLGLVLRYEQLFQSLEANADGSYKMALKTGVGSIKGSYQGTIKLADQRAPEHYRAGRLSPRPSRG